MIVQEKILYSLDELNHYFKLHHHLNEILWNLCNDYSETLERVKEYKDEFREFKIIDNKVVLFFDDKYMEPCVKTTPITIKELYKFQNHE